VSISFDHQVTIAPDVMLRMVRGEAVVLNLKTEMYLGLDAVAARMWALLHESPSIQHAYEALLEEYDVEPEVLRADIEEFVAQLIGQQLIDLHPPAPMASGGRA
jgi:hypothetical protein